MTRGRSRPSDRGVIAVLGLAGVLVALQGTLLVPMMARLGEIYGVSVVQGSWLITITLLVGALATPVVARLADMFGNRRMMLVSLFVLVAGSVLLAVTDSYVAALVGRGMAGFGSALMPVAMSAMHELLPPHRVASGLALVSATLGLGAAVGLPLSGAMYAALGWQSLFWMSAVVGALVMVATWRVLPVVPPVPVAGRRFDWPGSVLLVSGLVPLLVVVSQGNEWGWGSTPVVGLAVAAMVGFGLWVPWELRRTHPLVDLRVAAYRPVLLTNVASVLVAIGMLANLLLASLQLGTPRVVEGALGLSAGKVGLAMAVPAAVLVVTSPVVGRLLSRYGGRRLLVAGAVVMSGGYLARLVLDGSVLQVITGCVLVGIGTSLTFAAMPMIIMGSVPAGEVASANGLNSLCRMIGTSISTAGIAALISVTSVVVAGRDYPSALTSHAAFVICAGATLVAAVIACFVPRADEPVREPVPVR